MKYFIHKHTDYFDNHFPDKLGLATWFSTSVHRHRTGWNSLYPQGTSGCSPPTYINHDSKGFWSRRFYRLDALPVTQPMVSKHWRQ